jgi:hypothetical protein
VTTYREAKRAFDEVDAALTDALGRGDKVEAKRLCEEHVRCAKAFLTADAPDDPADEAEMLMQSIERYRNNDFEIPTFITERERAIVIASLEKSLSKVRAAKA